RPARPLGDRRQIHLTLVRSWLTLLMLAVSATEDRACEAAGARDGAVQLDHRFGGAIGDKAGGTLRGMRGVLDRMQDLGRGRANPLKVATSQPTELPRLQGEK